jgi:hypothetical protein
MTDLESFKKRRPSTLVRLRRVNAAIAAWDEWEAAELIPPENGSRLRHPQLSREVLESLRATLEEVLHEMEWVWERRNELGAAVATPDSVEECDGVVPHDLTYASL